MTTLQFFDNFRVMVANIFTGNWGPAPYPYTNPFSGYGYPLSQIYFDFLPDSVELALFAILIAIVIAYPLSLVLGWRRRPAADVPTRLTLLAGALLPTFIVAWLVIEALFMPFSNAYGDVLSSGMIPSFGWFVEHYGGYPPWVLLTVVTRPTGFPLVDGVVHGDWSFEVITFLKTLVQATVIAVAYVAIFLRQARNLVSEASREPHVRAARSRGIPESTLLWRHTARRVRPNLLMAVALTIPGYLLTQFVVEAAFNDAGVGWLTVDALTTGALFSLIPLFFVVAAFVLVAVLIVDLIANRVEPRGSVIR